MKIYDKITPEGTRDLLFEQCDARRGLERKLSGFFEQRGFQEVMTPGLEFYDVFYSNSNYFPQETMYKLTDGKGRLLVMRPDCTIPIARLAATKLSGLPKPIRLYYDQPVYRNNPAMKGRSDELLQMGVELIGAGSHKGDLEMLEMAVRCLQSCGLAQFRIEICSIGFFKALIQQLEAGDEEKEQIRELIESKNYAALNDFLDRFLPSKAAEALKKLPGLFGGNEVFQQAALLLDGEDFPRLLDELRYIYDGLAALGLGDQVMIDLGLVNQAEYYTGIIFRGYVEGIGEPVISGGRYDSLMGDFGEPQPATGFAVNVDLVAKALLQAGEMKTKKTDLLIFCEPGCEVKAFGELERLTSLGLKCEHAVFETLDEASAYARARKIGKIRFVGEETRDILTEGEMAR